MAALLGGLPTQALAQPVSTNAPVAGVCKTTDSSGKLLKESPCTAERRQAQVGVSHIYKWPDSQVTVREIEGKVIVNGMEGSEIVQAGSACYHVYKSAVTHCFKAGTATTGSAPHKATGLAGATARAKPKTTVKGTCSVSDANGKPTGPTVQCEMNRADGRQIYVWSGGGAVVIDQAGGTLRMNEMKASQVAESGAICYRDNKTSITHCFRATAAGAPAKAPFASLTPAEKAARLEAGKAATLAERDRIAALKLSRARALTSGDCNAVKQADQQIGDKGQEQECRARVAPKLKQERSVALTALNCDIVDRLDKAIQDNPLGSECRKGVTAKQGEERQKALTELSCVEVEKLDAVLGGKALGPDCRSRVEQRVLTMKRTAALHRLDCDEVKSLDDRIIADKQEAHCREQARKIVIAAEQTKAMKPTRPNLAGSEAHIGRCTGIGPTHTYHKKYMLPDSWSFEVANSLNHSRVRPHSVKVSEDGKRVFAAFVSGTERHAVARFFVVAMDTETSRIIWSIEDAEGELTAMAVRGEQLILFKTKGNYFIQVFSQTNGAMLSESKGDYIDPRAIAVDDEGKKYIVARNSNSISIRNVTTGNEIEDIFLPKGSGDPSELAFLDHRVIVLTTRELLIWDTRSRSWVKIQQWLPVYSKERMSISRTSGRLVYRNGDWIEVVDIASGKAVRRIEVGTLVEFVNISADGERVATVDRNNVGRIWDVSSGAVVGSYGENVLTINFSDDGCWVIVGTADRSFDVWSSIKGTYAGSISSAVSHIIGRNAQLFALVEEQYSNAVAAYHFSPIARQEAFSSTMGGCARDTPKAIAECLNHKSRAANRDCDRMSLIDEAFRKEHLSAEYRAIKCEIGVVRGAPTWTLH